MVSALSVEPRADGYMSKEFLYRRLGCAVIVILMAAGGAAAQERPQLKRPHDDTPEQKPAETKKTKKVKGPRAVGLLQLSNGKATLIPVAILVDGKFYDASAYKAEPVPMALEGGTVYEAEQAGEPQGLFTTGGALHSKSAESTNPWIGTGSYLPKGTEVAKTTHKAEDVPVGLDNSGDEPPRLTRKSGASSSNPAGDSKSGGASDKNTDKGAEKRPTSQEPAASGEASAGKASGGSTSPDQTAKSQTPQAQEETNYYRPTLRRGKPTQAAPEEEKSASNLVKAGSTGSAVVSDAKPSQILPAISDAGGPEPQSYKFFWKEGEEEERRKQMLVLAGDEVRAYVNARAKGAIGAKPQVTRTGVAGRKAVKPVQPAFENVQFRALDVWRSGQPVMILYAEARFPVEPGAALAPETYSLTLVSRTDIYGSLRKLYSGVTDKYHLDVTPQLELIDAVDADGDGRGELLFRETTDSGKGYVIYRATGDKLWKMFDSRRAE
ncbi:MAG: hypothetical protein JWQ87_3320 [Candidatus Sulfotelmatobacter sp.]|nr:hypothetical protein [Candidatus Sulfotelmatobacter sp.]